MALSGRFSKAQARRIRELGAIAYERELSSALATLEQEFSTWRSGKIDAFALERAIHKFHQGPARELFSQYDGRMLDLAVAAALNHGVLSAEEVGHELRALFPQTQVPDESQDS